MLHSAPEVMLTVRLLSAAKRSEDSEDTGSKSYRTEFKSSTN